MSELFKWDSGASSGVPSGSITMFAAAAAPDGWLLCQGQAVSREDYSVLFGIIGTAYGVGDGSTTFNLPDLRGNVPVGLKSTDADFDALGETGGVKTHTLTSAQMPAHTHTQNAHTHTQNAHAHKEYLKTTGYETSWTFDWSGSAAIHYSGATDRNTDNTTATNQDTTPTNQNTGGGEAHPNVQPYIVLNYIIKI